MASRPPQNGRIAARHPLRPTEQVALQIVDAQLEKYCVLLAILDPFGDDATAGDPPHIDHGAQNLTAHRVLLDAGDEVAIDFHIVGTDRRPGLQPRGARPEIVDRDVTT